MPRCDRCEAEIPISETALDEAGDPADELSQLQEPSDEPFTVIEGAFAVWTADYEVENRGRFPLLLCRDCTETFVDWIDNPDVVPDGAEDYDFSLDWTYVDR
jgi:hypothetical protein